MLKKASELKEKIKLIEFHSWRIKFLKLIHIALAVILIGRFVMINHISANYYTAYVQKESVKTTVKKTQARGTISDRNGKVLVSNTPVSSIVYYYQPNTSNEALYNTAFTLAKMIDIDTSKLTYQSRVSMYRQLNPGVLAVEKEDLEALTEENLKAQVIFNRMSEAYYGGENTLKIDATDAEVASVVESVEKLPGVDVITTFKRTYPTDLGLYDIIGRVSKGDSSMLTDDFTKYLDIGYTINDQIGISSIEKQYESYLRGFKEVVNEFDESESIILTAGVRGADLTLSIDTILSDGIDLLLEYSMSNAVKLRPGARYLKEAYVVVIDPRNGEILSLNGKILNDDFSFTDHSLGTMHNAFTVGSVVKGATLLTGYEHNVTNFGDVIYDRPMIFADGTKKASWTTLGLINDIDALRTSSNVYFMQQAIRLGGDNYHPKTNLFIDDLTLEVHRSSFEQYGLGTYTGIDLPNEQIGLKNQDTSIAKLLDFTIGQSDTYTTLQLAQYTATIANGGNRYALRLLKEASTQNNDGRQIIYTSEPQLINKINLPSEAFLRVQEGFRQVLQHPTGTGYPQFKNSNYSPAGKTGTAEEFVRDSNGNLIFDWRGQLIETNHLTFVGYAPHYAPEIAIAVVFPQAELEEEKNPIALEVANDIINLYFELQKKS